MAQENTGKHHQDLEPGHDPIFRYIDRSTEEEDPDETERRIVAEKMPGMWKKASDQGEFEQHGVVLRPVRSGYRLERSG